MSPLPASQVIDDSGNKITLDSSAKRIITLAPYLTELVYSAGAGDRLVATVSYSDFPEPTKSLPRIGNSQNIDIESVVAMVPDLVLVWRSGNGPSLLKKLEHTGITVFESEPDSIELIASTIFRIGKLTGTEHISSRSGKLFLENIELLRTRYSDRSPIRTFYQFWDSPIYTIGGYHLISRIIEICGGDNIYSNLNSLTPIVDIESVLQLDPEIIITSGENNDRPKWLDNWRKWQPITAVKNNDLYHIPPELIQRHSVRIVQGMQKMCEMIENVRIKK